jgi:hypothetical protein
MESRDLPRKEIASEIDEKRTDGPLPNKGKETIMRTPGRMILLFIY